MMGAEEPNQWLGTSFATVAVTSFFALSGFLLSTKSYENSTLEFLFKRFARIMPGLAVAILFTITVALVSNLVSRNQISVMDYVYYAYTNLSVVNPNRQFAIGGAFAGNPLAGNVNGSLWSITPEFWCYFSLALIGSLIRRFKHRAVALLSISLVVIFTSSLYLSKVGSFSITELVGFPLHLLPAFLFGAAYAQMYSLTNKRFASLLPGIAASGLPVLITASYSLNYYSLGWVLAVSAVLLLSTWQLHFRFGLSRDLSLGVYVLAFPAQQIVVEVFGRDFPYLAIFAISSALTLGLAWLSAKYVEEPVIRQTRLLFSTKQQARTLDKT
jgi:peptidoglycan/LPS O-acetylase OafA/YrhL